MSVSVNSVSSPLVSVLMTAYNREKYITEAIQSVIDSNYVNFELIIVDDGSKDNTVAIARNFTLFDNRVKLYINEQNLGDYLNRNKAASYAKGEYIMYVDSDDKIHSDGLEKCISAMLQYPESGIGMMLVNKNSEPFELSSAEVIRKHFFEVPMLNIGPGGTIIKKNFFEKISFYPVKYGPANDLYFNLKAASRSNVVMLPFDFLFYRIHDGQEAKNFYSYIYNNYLYLKDALDELQLQLTRKEIVWINSKNKRRLFVNVVKYFASTLDFKKTKYLLTQTKFSFKDMFQAIFH